MPENRTAKHKVVTDGGGYRFIFYCDVSDAHVCTTGQIYQGDSEEEALLATEEYQKKLAQCIYNGINR